MLGLERNMAVDVKASLRKALRSVVRSLRQFAYAGPIPSHPAKPTSSRPRVGLALGGGFARGMAHIGVLKVFAENAIPIDALAGTSAGSIAAALYASGCRVEEMIEEARRIRWNNFARWTLPRLGFATNERMEGMLRQMLGCSRFEELSIPLAIVAADISTGETVIFRHGDLIPPLRASCSVPGLFAPVEYQGRLLVDGAIVGSVPVAPLREFGVDTIIAVSLKAGEPRHTPTNLFQVVGQAFQIAGSRSETTWRGDCDLTIEPDVTDFKWDDFARADEMILAGERAARQALPTLRALVQPRVLIAPHPILAR